MEGSPILETRNIHKRFGEIWALRGVDFVANHGELVGLIGDNGAGKSTLIKILAALYKPDSGEIYFEGERVKIHSPRDAHRLGIETLYQDQVLVDCMEVVRNIFMGREITRLFGFLRLKEMREKSMGILKSIGLSIESPDRNVKFLSGGERQGVAMARALYYKARVLNVDEPTIALSAKGVERVIPIFYSSHGG